MELPVSQSTKTEHPRPDFYRKQWVSLNGTWEFHFEGASLLKRQRGNNDQICESFDYNIEVPFTHQSRLARLRRQSDGAHVGADMRNCEVLWYRRQLELPQQWLDKRVLLHFEAVDYQSSVWLNGQFLVRHQGGHVPFTVDLGMDLGQLHGTARQRYLDGELELLLRVYDPLNPAIPRGKQSWESPAHCWYTQSSGIWQSVWLEAVPETYLNQQQIQCSLNSDQSSARLDIRLRGNQPATETLYVSAKIMRGGHIIDQSKEIFYYPLSSLQLHIAEPELWSPESPVLYDLYYAIEDASGNVLDQVQSYIGVRSIALSRHGLLLNSVPYYQRLVLDQGYWPDGRYTAPSDAALRRDIELAKAAGFNGCRKHMKVEEARFLYWADRLGFLVWGEFPAPYVFSAESRSNVLTEWPKVLERDRNHPSVIAWTVYNESWGVGAVGSEPDQQAWLQTVCQLSKAIDPSRPVIDNDGWEHVQSDIYTYHTYKNCKEALDLCHENMARRSQRSHEHDPDAAGFPLPMMAGERIMPDMPVLISEFGGIGYVAGSKSAKDSDWGYADIPMDEAGFKARFEEIMNAIYSYPDLCGFCYTQLTDVDQEINGILSFDREPKFDLDYFRKWFGKIWL